MTRILLENVSAEHKSGANLIDVSMLVEDGEYVAVLGPTGSGPSELLKVIAGLLPVTTGKIFLDEKDVSDLPPEDRHIGMVFEQFNLFPHLSVMDNLLYGPRMRRSDIEKKKKIAAEIINMVRLNGREDAISRELSGGMQQRVGIARALVADSQLLLLDQPYRALDAKIRAEMRLEVRNIVKGIGISCLHSTHETEEAMLVADKIAIFNAGRLQQIGTPEEVFNFPNTEFVASFLAESNIWDIEIKDNVIILDNTLNIKYNADLFPEDKYSRMVLRQHSIDLFSEKDQIPNDWNGFHGKITRVRLLGEFIRITVNVEGKEFIIRELLNPDLRDPLLLVDKELWVGFPVDEVKLF